MKRFLIRAGAKIGRFFWSRGFLKFVLWTVTLVILFYVEEDWRGARAWAATKAKWEARGESLDYSKFIPAPIPDDENLAVIPLFKLDSYPNTKDMDDLNFITLQKAMRNGLPGNDVPNVVNWDGAAPDMEKIRSTIATDFAAAFKDTTAPSDTLAQFDALYPFLDDLRAASATRPLCRFNVNYAFYPPMGRAVGFLTNNIRLSEILTLHAVLALDHHRPGLALEDIKVNYKLLLGVQRDPSLIGGLVALGMNSIGMSAIYNGLAQHAWNDAQLVEIDHILQRIDYLASYQFAMRSEAAESAADTDYFKKARPDLSGWLTMDAQIYDRDLVGWPLFLRQSSVRVARIFPGGWWDQNKCQTPDIFLSSVSLVDLKTRRALPDQLRELQKRIKRLTERKDAYAPWNFLFTEWASSVPNSVSQFANAQSRVDEARIACALERYRLAHGAYPDSLDALAPAYIDELPHDIINGEPFHYRLRPDGTFLLYSVGWNQTDEGGKIVFKNEAGTSIDNLQGDWAWPTPQAVLGESK